MEAWLLGHSARLYQGGMVAAFVLIACWETWRPRKALAFSTARRWSFHALLMAIVWSITWIVFPMGSVGLSVAVASSPYGLLNRAAVSFSLRFVIAFLLIDLVAYAQHYSLHRIPLLWRLHRLHHADTEYDLTTGVRFHPLESIYSRCFNLAVIALAAPPVSAVICYELVNMMENFYGHANVRLPARLDRLMRLVQVTPELHRVHHSVEVSDQNKNFGAVLTIWDRLFGTLRDHPVFGDARLRFGLGEVNARQSVQIWDMLALPFRSETKLPDDAAVPEATRSAVR